MTRTTTLTALLGGLLIAAGAAAADEPQATAPDAPTATVASPGAVAPAAPTAGARGFDADAATAAYLSQLSPEARAKSDAYFEGGYWLLVWDFVGGLFVAWLFLGTGLSARIRDRIERFTHRRWLQTATYAALYILGSSLVLLPWSAYEGYFREHQYGMSNQTLGAWLGDQAKGLLIGMILGAIALTLIYAVLRRAPRTWWIWGAVVAVSFAAAVSMLVPVYLEPVFNDFEPLAESPLKHRILSLAHANGIPATDVYEYDASKQTKRISAHVSGLLGTTQISLNDNLLNRGSEGEVLAVLGHEMGHYVLNHVYEGLMFLGLMLVGGFAFIHGAFDRVRRGIGARWGIRDIGDVAGIPLLIFLFSLYSFILTPVQNTVTRTMEAEADVFGVNASRQPDGFAQAAVHLSEYRKMAPGPLEEWLFYDHPSGYNRIHRVMVWKGEHLDDPDIAAYDAAHPTLAAP
jgi:STE24 endopeptidase